MVESAALTNFVLIDEYEAAKLTGFAVSTLRSQRVRGGGPPFYKTGRSVKYEQNETIAWVVSRRCISTTDALRLRHQTDEVAGTDADEAFRAEAAAERKDRGRPRNDADPRPAAATGTRRNRKSQSRVPVAADTG